MTLGGRGRQVTADSLERYLGEIARYPLIDREEEARLARAIRSGDEEALNDLVRANLRFVVSVAKKYRSQGVPLPDLINEGNLGLIRAAHRFDESRGIKFISYAVWWVRQAILQALAEQSRVVRVPLNRSGALHRMGRRARQMEQELGREPTPEELARELDLPAEEVRSTLALARTPLSLDAPSPGNDDTRLADYLPDQFASDPENETWERALRETVAKSLETLDPRQAKVLRLYYGLDDLEPMTLEEIGDQLGVTRERVRQIREQALERLRHATRARYLEAFSE
ncbi:MAG: sigma-70 family RNA polymerase sigma factor [Gemmatimonadales bacterium]|nr:MAG: sigma-70 family RNA polymerase sigma factor [Gemmatimonadales bacterium]